MSFQWVIDNASTMSIDARGMVGTTMTRDGVTRSVSRGGQPWRFTVTAPLGPRWEDYRSYIAGALKLDRHTESIIDFSASGLDWLFPYKGDLTSFGSLQSTYTAGYSTAQITGGTGGSPYRFRAGDLIQLGDYVYMVVQDVPGSQTQVQLHRPLIESGTATYSTTLKIGTECQFKVKATSHPQPNIFDRNQVTWDEPFVFTEVID